MAPIEVDNNAPLSPELLNGPQIGLCSEKKGVATYVTKAPAKLLLYYSPKFRGDVAVSEDDDGMSYGIGHDLPYVHTEYVINWMKRASRGEVSPQIGPDKNTFSLEHTISVEYVCLVLDIPDRLKDIEDHLQDQLMEQSFIEVRTDEVVKMAWRYFRHFPGTGSRRLNSIVRAVVRAQHKHWINEERWREIRNYIKKTGKEALQDLFAYYLNEN